MREIIVIGAGLAGAFAAATLARAGRSVRVLEARDRVGGRALARPLNGSEPLELGGSWITPWQKRLPREAERLGLRWRPRTEFSQRRWWHDGELLTAPPPAERGEHERVLARLAGNVAALEAGRLPPVSFKQWLDDLDAPRATRELLSAWWCLTGSADWAHSAASGLIGGCGHGDGTPDGIADAYLATLEGGMDRLAAGLLETDGISLELSVAVTAVHHGGDRVEIETADGRRLSADATVLATGLNPLRRIVFEPPLPATKRRAIERGHGGIAVKIWAEVEGVVPGILATGGGEGIEWMFSERDSGRGTAFLIGFGLASPGFDPGDRAQVERAVLRFFPEARLVAHDHHDWIADPCSLGTWVSPPIDLPDATAPAAWQPEGRLFFASSDFAAEDAGWFEGAAVSGEAAANAVLAAR